MSTKHIRVQSSHQAGDRVSLDGTDWRKPYHIEMQVTDVGEKTSTATVTSVSGEAPLVDGWRELCVDDRVVFPNQWVNTVHQAEQEVVRQKGQKCFTRKATVSKYTISPTPAKEVPECLVADVVAVVSLLVFDATEIVEEYFNKRLPVLIATY